jgi:hypothetical protein
VHVDNDDLPREFLPTDETSFSDLSDTEKPVTPDEEEGLPVEEPEVLKAAGDAKKLVEQEQEGARALFEEVRGE